MFKWETLSVMNCYHIKVVNLYQLPFKVRGSECRTAGEFPSTAFCNPCLPFLWGKEMVLDSRPKCCSNWRGLRNSICGDLLLEKERQKSKTYNWKFGSEWKARISVPQKSLCTALDSKCYHNCNLALKKLRWWFFIGRKINTFYFVHTNWFNTYGGTNLAAGVLEHTQTKIS